MIVVSGFLQTDTIPKPYLNPIPDNDYWINTMKIKPDAVFRATKEAGKNMTPEFMEKVNNTFASVLARRALEKKLAARRAYHEAVLNKMVEPEFAQEVRDYALLRVAIWRKGKTCSEFYSDTWERIMNMDSIGVFSEFGK